MQLVTREQKEFLEANDALIQAGSTLGTIVTANKSATQAALTDNSGGAAADGTIAVITNPTLSDWNGTSVYPSAVQATAINAAITSTKDAIKELSTKQNAVIAALKTAGIML